MNVGDQVKLKTGGPCMVIEDISYRTAIRCVRYDPAISGFVREDFWGDVLVECEGIDDGV